MLNLFNKLKTGALLTLARKFSQQHTASSSFLLSKQQFRTFTTDTKENREEPHNCAVQLLECIVKGYLDKAGNMLKANHLLTLSTATVTDHVGKIYEKLTALQLAVGLLDYQMWIMIIKIMQEAGQKNEIAKQLEYFRTDVGNGIMQESWWRIQDIIDALDFYIKNYDIMACRRLSEYWVNEVGGCQKRTLIWVLQEKYANPMPNPLNVRKDIFAEKHLFSLDQIGVRYGLINHNGECYLDKGDKLWHLHSSTKMLPWSILKNYKSLVELLQERIKQRNELLDHYFVIKNITLKKNN